MSSLNTMYASSSFYAMLFGDRTHDLPFYLGLGEAAGGAARVLELGVGRGRVALALARAGHRVLGLDDAPAMLAAFAERIAQEPPEVRARLSWTRGCVREIRLAERFDLVVCPFNGIAHQLSDAELAAFFSRAREHLAPRGRFAFDVLIADAERTEDARIDIPWFRHPVYGSSCRATEIHRWEQATQTLTVALTVRFMEEERLDETYRLVLRLHSPDALEATLVAHGFALEQRQDLVDVVALVVRAR